MLRNKYFLLHIKKSDYFYLSSDVLYFPFSERKKKFRPVIYKEAESKMAAYIVFETGHTFGPSMLYPVYRSVPTNNTPQSTSHSH